MKILIEESVLRQAMDALSKTMPVFKGTCAWHTDVDKAITALRTALDAAEKCEPVAWMMQYKGECMGFLPYEESGTIPVYPHPAPAVPSYDVEKWQLVPKEPTEEMLNAACLSQAECEFKDYDDWRDAHSNATVKSLRNILKKDYESMLQAAPKPEDI